MKQNNSLFRKKYFIIQANLLSLNHQKCNTHSNIQFLSHPLKCQNIDYRSLMLAAIKLHCSSQCLFILTSCALPVKICQTLSRNVYLSSHSIVFYSLLFKMSCMRKLEWCFFKFRQDLFLLSFLFLSVS